MALLYFVQISRSLSPQLSPCHNRTQIALRSKQEFPGLVNFIFFSLYFPVLSSRDNISFRHESGSAHVKFDRLNQQSNLIVWVDLSAGTLRTAGTHAV